MFADKETIMVDILVFIFLVVVCSIVYGAIVRDTIVLGFGIVMLLLFFGLLWGFKRFRKH